MADTMTIYDNVIRFCSPIIMGISYFQLIKLYDIIILQ